LEGSKKLGKKPGGEQLKKGYFVFRNGYKTKKNKPSLFSVSTDRTALHIALRMAAKSKKQGYPRVIRALLQLGAKTSKQGKNNKTALVLQKELLPGWPSLDNFA